jgi:hypothetical protein
LGEDENSKVKTEFEAALTIDNIPPLLENNLNLI